MLNQFSAFRLYVTVSAFGFLAIIVGLVFRFSALDKAEMPPSLNPGASLFQGKLFSTGVAYYYSDQELTVKRIVECMNSDAGRVVFVYYSPGEGNLEKGFYIYPEKFGTNAHLVANAEEFKVKAGRVFGLFVDGVTDTNCYKPVSEAAAVAVGHSLKSVKEGWVQVAANSKDISAVLQPVRNRVKYMWIQTGQNTFRNILKENFETATLIDHYSLWVKLIDCDTVGADLANFPECSQGV